MNDPKQKPEFDNVYTAETAPGVVEYGQVRSIATTLNNHDATNGVMDSGTVASFPADERGERITIGDKDLFPDIGEVSTTLPITITDPETGEEREIELDAENPTVQIPGRHQISVDLSKIAVPAVYTCEYTDGSEQA